MIRVGYPHNNKSYTINIGGISFTAESSDIPDCYVHAYDADYGYDYILCGYKEGTKIISNPSNTGNELIYLVPPDVADKFAKVLNRRNYRGMDWVVDEY